MWELSRSVTRSPLVWCQQTALGTRALRKGRRLCISGCCFLTTECSPAVVVSDCHLLSGKICHQRSWPTQNLIRANKANLQEVSVFAATQRMNSSHTSQSSDQDHTYAGKTDVFFRVWAVAHMRAMFQLI